MQQEGFRELQLSSGTKYDMMGFYKYVLVLLSQLLPQCPNVENYILDNLNMQLVSAMPKLFTVHLQRF